MKPETHPIGKEQVMAYLDGELSADAAKAVAVHLDQCAACGELAEDLRVISSRMPAWSIESASKKLGETVLAELINGEVRKAHTHTHGKWPSSGMWKRVLQNRWTWAIAGVVAVVACFFTVSPALFEMHKAAIAPSRSQVTAGLTSGPSGKELYMIAGVSEEEKENQISIGPMIARTASLKISVKDFPSARTSVSRIVAAHKGYVASLTISSQTGAAQSLNTKLAIPAAEYDAALTDLRGLGHIEQEQQGGEEVTSQVVDLDARLKNARETEGRLTEVLRTRTGKIGDVLEVEKEMGRVRGDIERMEAEEKQLHDRVAFASIDLNLTEEYQAQLGDGPSSAGRQIRNALVDGYHGAADGLLSVFVFFLSVGPSLALWALILFWPARWAWRRWRKSHEMA